MAAGLPTVEYLATARIGEKGQLTVPKEYRDSLGLAAGSPVAVLRIGGALILVPEHARFMRLCQSIASELASHGISAEQVQAELPESRRRVFARHYPELAARRRRARAKYR